MAGEDIIMMSQKELKRLHVVHKILDKKLKQVKATGMLSLCGRQITQRPKQQEKKSKYIVAIAKKGHYRPPMEHPFKGPMFRRRYPHINTYPQKEKELLLVH